MNLAKILNNKIFVSIAAIICTMLWGSAFPMIKLGYEELNIENKDIQNILIFAGTRFFFASCLIILIESIWKKQWITLPKKDFLSISVIGIFNTFLQYLFFYIGLVNTTGAKASVLNSSITFFTLALAHFLFREDQLTFKKIIGCIFGIAGVIIINIDIFNEKNDEASSNDLSFSVMGDGMILLSSLCAAIGTVLIKIKNSYNKNELFNSYKNWVIFRYPLQLYHWLLIFFQKIFCNKKNKIGKKDQLKKDNENTYNIKQSKQTTINEKTENTFENETLHYPFDFDKIFDKDVEYLSSLDRNKNSSLNENTLRNSLHSNDSNHNSSIYNHYLYEENPDSDFEEIEISSFSSKVIRKNHGSINHFNNNDSKSSLERNNSQNMNNNMNKNDSIYQIVNLYSNDSHDIIMLTGYQMLVGSLFLNIIGLLWNIFFNSNQSNNNYDYGEKTPFTSIGLYGYLIIGYMIIITAIAFSLWNTLIKYNSVGFLSFFNFLIPIFGTLFSGLLLRESIFTFINLISLILVSIGVIISSF